MHKKTQTCSIIFYILYLFYFNTSNSLELKYNVLSKFKDNDRKISEAQEICASKNFHRGESTLNAQFFPV